MPGTALPVDAAMVPRLPVASILPSPRNPRRSLDDLADLAASIGEYGLLQPVVVRAVGDGYELVAGHRRVAAAQQLGWTEIPAIVREADEDEAYLLTLVENLQRADLTPREESRALERLVRERGWTTRQVAAAVKRSQAYVSKRLRVFEDPALAPLVLRDRLPVSVAEELLPVPPRRRKELAERAAAERWDGPTARAAARGSAGMGSGSRQRGAGTSLLRALRTTRTLLKGTFPEDLEEAHRREMRLLFLDLAVFARAPAGTREIVLPSLSAAESKRRRTG